MQSKPSNKVIAVITMGEVFSYFVFFLPTFYVIYWSRQKACFSLKKYQKFKFATDKKMNEK
jgi:hypothetical protein